jgi:hypothetical protein
MKALRIISYILNILLIATSALTILLYVIPSKADNETIGYIKFNGDADYELYIIDDGYSWEYVKVEYGEQIEERQLTPYMTLNECIEYEQYIVMYIGDDMPNFIRLEYTQR